MDASQTTRPSVLLGPCIAGLALLLVYAGVGNALPFTANAGRGFLYVSRSELFFWLAHLGLVVPGVSLVTYGLAPRLGPRLRAIHESLRTLDERRWFVLGALYFLLLLVLAIAGRSLILLDLPITDDENGVLFGARMLAAGHLKVPVLEPHGAYPTLFTYQRDGWVMSMDFPGSILFAAATLLTRLGSIPYAVLAAATGLATAYAAGVLWGWRARVVAALIWLFSPMALTLSMTTHTHLLSRAFVAFALACYARIAVTRESDKRPLLRDGVLLGLCAGLAFLTRPFESGMLLLPAAIHLGVRGWRGSANDRRLLVAAIGPLVLCLAVFAWYNSATTGSWYLPARYDLWLDISLQRSMWLRLGTNLGFNWILLLVFFLGPIGALLSAAGLRRHDRRSLVLGTGVVGVLLLAVLYDNTGIHLVGPIHYSECVVPLTLLGAAGVLRLSGGLGRVSLSRVVPALLLVGYLVGGMGLFIQTHALSLREQADNQNAPFVALEQAGIRDAVIFARAPRLLYSGHDAMRASGSWVLAFPHPDPFLRGRLIFVHQNADTAALRRRFPGLPFYSLRYGTSGEPVVVVPRNEP